MDLDNMIRLLKVLDGCITKNSRYKRKNRKDLEQLDVYRTALEAPKEYVLLDDKVYCKIM